MLCVLITSFDLKHNLLFMEITIDFAFIFTLCLQESIKEVDVCAQENTQKYLNRKDVQTALHAQLVGIKEWSLCSRQ